MIKKYIPDFISGIFIVPEHLPSVIFRPKKSQTMKYSLPSRFSTKISFENGFG